MSPKSYTVFIDDKNTTRACLTFAIHDNSKDTDKMLEAQGCKVIGYVSAGTERDAIIYGDEVLREPYP